MLGQVEHAWKMCTRHRLTTHKFVLADRKDTLGLQWLWMGTAGIAQGEEGVLCHPQWEPLQLAVTEQT